MGEYNQLIREISSMELSALMSSKVCHDLISPVGAIVNGLEIIDEDPDEETKLFAQELIAKSAHQASAKLQFARLAWGAAGSAGSTIDSREAGRLAGLYLISERSDLNWQVPPDLLPKTIVRLLLNLVVVATAAVPRGGIIEVKPEGRGYALYCSGAHSRIPQMQSSVINDYDNSSEIDAHKVQAYYTRLLAKQANMTILFSKDDDTVLIRCLTPN